ncbi:DUF3391 domain-containing protein, partial [Acinetobacter baumannii]
AAWLDHPFWKNKFLLKNEADLRQAHGSGIEHCWIDPERGLDVAEAAAEAGTDEAAAPAEPSPELPPGPDIDTTLMEAEALRENAKKATKAMFSEARLGKALDMERCVTVVEE